MTKTESTTPAVLTITPKAAIAIRKVIDQEKVPAGYALRVGIRGGGCGTMGYILGFDKQTLEDQAYEIDGFQVIIDKRHSMYILGMEIDWHEDEHQRGFVFNNPSARKTASEQAEAAG